MKKMSVVLTIALLLCIATTALAVPSKTTQVVTVTDVTTSTGVALPETFVLEVGVESPAASSVLTNIFTFVSGGQPVISFFNEDVRDQIAMHISADVALDKLEMNEFVPLAVFDYDPAMGDLQIALALQTLYAPGDEIVVLGGIITITATGENSVEWFVFDAFVNDEGQVVVVLTQEFLEQVAQGNAVLAVMSAKAE